MRFFNLDFHVSVIADIRYLWKKIFPNVEIVEWSLSGHTHLFNKKRNENPIIQKLDSSLTFERMKEFTEKYSDFLSSFDGFIVTHSPVLCCLYETFGKPIFLVNSCRYENPYCWKNEIDNWNRLSESLSRMWKKGILHVVSNNLADQEYLRLGTGIESTHIPSYCGYILDSVQKDVPSVFQFLWDGPRIFENFEDIPSKKEFLGQNYSWKNLVNGKVLIVIPYEISTMSFFEYATAGVPVLIPSRKLLQNLLQEKKILFYGRYASPQNGPVPENLLPALSEDKWIDFWLERADLYNSQIFPTFIIFEDEEDLREKISLLKQQAPLRCILQRQIFTDRLPTFLSSWVRILISAGFYLPGNGQINLNSEFGLKIFHLLKEENPSIRNIVEIGTWNGEGSTNCIFNALLSRKDFESCNFFSIEASSEMFNRAKKKWEIFERKGIHLLHGHIGNEFFSANECRRRSRKNDSRFDAWLEGDKKNVSLSPDVYSQLPFRIDVVLLDGGEFSSDIEFDLLLKGCPRIILLDDTSVAKCRFLDRGLENCPDWKRFYKCNSPSRNGASIFIRNPETESFFSEFIWVPEDVLSTDCYLSLENSKRVYCKTDVLYRGQPISWRNFDHFPVSEKCHLLLTGHSDYPITREIFEKYESFCERWYCINRQYDHRKLFSLPLGVTNDCDDSPIHRIFGNNQLLHEVFQEPKTEKNLAYLNLNIQTFPSERQKVFDLFSKESWVLVGENTPTEEGRKKYLKEIRSSTFVFCPRGNGIDTHRLWESLYLGAIPICIENMALREFCDLPILFIQNWEQISPSFLEKEAKRIHACKWNLQKLKFSYWKRILETDGSFGIAY